MLQVIIFMLDVYTDFILLQAMDTLSILSVFTFLPVSLYVFLNPGHYEVSKCLW